VEGSTASLTALVDLIGYQVAQEVACEARSSGRTVRSILILRGLLTGETFDELISAECVMRLGSPPAKNGTQT
jgi:aspartate ammonia-lyase